MKGDIVLLTTVHTYMYRCGIREVSSSKWFGKSKANGAVGWRNDRGNLDE